MEGRIEVAAKVIDWAMRFIGVVAMVVIASFLTGWLWP